MDTPHVQSIEVRPRRHFKHTKKSHQSTEPRFKPTATAPHPLHGGFVIPRNKTQSPLADGRSAHKTTRTHAETTMPNNSSTLIEKSSSQPTDPLEPQNRDRSRSLNPRLETKTPDSGFRRVREQGPSRRTLKQTIHRRRQATPTRVETFGCKPTPELEVPVELRPQSDTPPGVRHAVRETSPVGNARHTNRSQQMLHEKRSRTHRERDMLEKIREFGHLPHRSRCMRRRGANAA